MHGRIQLNRWLYLLPIHGDPAVLTDETTSYCKARSRLPKALFERLLRWTATRREEATEETVIALFGLSDGLEDCRIAAGAGAA